MDAFFVDLGRRVRERWQAVDFSLAAFPGLAQAALEENPPATRVDLTALTRAFLRDDEQPFQTASGFGQPELVVFDGPRFYIQVLFWLDGTTQIHQHEFSGAFHVLEGSSLHAEFAFANVRPVTAHFRLGDLQLTGTELLETGRTVPITSGGASIHSLFHLETPSVTVVVRTHSDPGTGPQFTYLPPHVAVDPFFSDALTTRRLQLLDVLDRTAAEDYAEVVRAVVASLDYERGFFTLQNCLVALQERGEWEETWDVFAKKHGPLAAYAAPTLEEIVWRDRLVNLRGSIEDADHRFFLALLLNVPRASDILSLVAARFPGDPVTTVLGWAEELSESSEAGTWILDAEYPAGEEEAGSEAPLDRFLGTLARCLKGETKATDAARREALAQSSLRALVA
jgi:ribulose-5-phosphate 4-epimerase/fuculose-1-phosphate aldolase